LPSTPTGLVAAPNGSNAIDLSWNASTDDVEVVGYHIYREGTEIGTTASTQYSDSGLAASTEYTYTVSAYDEAGNQSAQSMSASAITDAGAPEMAIVALTVENQRGSTQTNIPVTFGQIFKPGDVATGTNLALRLADGSLTALPGQIDVKATHADGSIRHAIITTRLPELSASQKQGIEIVASEFLDSSPSVSLNSLLASGFDANVTLDIGGDLYHASAAKALTDYTPEIWLEGPEVTEWIVAAPIENANGASHAHLSARFNIRAYKGLSDIRVDVIIENTWAYESHPKNYIYSANVTGCGEDLYTVTDLTHYRQARWRKTFWCGNEPDVHIMHDLDYLITTGAILNYDDTLGISEEHLSSMDANWSGDKIEPMGPGFIYTTMPATGARADIGPLPRWTTRYLLSQDARAKKVTLGTADLAGSWNIHYRDKSTGLPVSLNDYPYMSILSRNTYDRDRGVNDAFPDCDGDCTTPFRVDSAHQPSISYIPYLVTGDHYHLEELLFWANYNILQYNPAYRDQEKGLVKSEQVRGQAWSLRTLGHAAYISPDLHPMKQYFVDRVAYNLEYYNTEYTDNSSAPIIGYITNGSAIKRENGQGRLSPWNDDAFTMVVGWLVDLGFTDAIPLRNWKIRFIYGRFSNHPVFCKQDAATYRYVVQEKYGEGDLLENWASILSATFPDHVGNCPENFNGNPGHPESYLAITRGALSAAVAAGYSQARDYYGEVISVLTDSGADFNLNPHWAIAPR
jgi:hypothetical protein